jgi:hypothetical protein
VWRCGLPAYIHTAGPTHAKDNQTPTIAPGARPHITHPRVIAALAAHQLLTARDPGSTQLPPGSISAAAAEQGRLSLNVRLFADERDRHMVTGLTNQFLLAFPGAASGITGAMLPGTPGGPKISPSVSLNDAGRLAPQSHRPPRRGLITDLHGCLPFAAICASTA